MEQLLAGVSWKLRQAWLLQDEEEASTSDSNGANAGYGDVRQAEVSYDWRAEEIPHETKSS